MEQLAPWQPRATARLDPANNRPGNSRRPSLSANLPGVCDERTTRSYLLATAEPHRRLSAVQGSHRRYPVTATRWRSAPVRRTRPPLILDQSCGPHIRPQLCFSVDGATTEGQVRALAGTITALRFQQRNRERVNVYLDGAFAFGLPAVSAAALHVGQQLSEDEIADLLAQDAAQRAYEQALRFLASRPRSIAEVRRRLEQQALPPATIEAVIGRLLAAGYLDDEAFARFWVSNREQWRPRAPLALRQELRQKGIADDVIARALQAVDSESSAHRAGLAQARRWENLDRRTFRHKLGSYLLRRGFGHDVVWPVVDQIWNELREGTEPGEEENGWQ